MSKTKEKVFYFKVLKIGFIKLQRCRHFFPQESNCIQQLYALSQSVLRISWKILNSYKVY
jgi:hypothetical protein